jgi:AcrR family transcriptional regulator
LSARAAAKGDAKNAVLDTAERLFYAEGYRAVGVDRVIAESGVAKATFYRHFPSKDELLLAVLEARDARLSEELERRAVERTRSAGERPLALFDALADWMSEPTFRGCAFLNSMIEVADPAHPVHAAAHRHKSNLARLFRRFLAEAGIAQAEELAEQLVLLLDGAIVTSLREGGSGAALRARVIARLLVQSASSRPASSKPASSRLASSRPASPRRKP